MFVCLRTRAQSAVELLQPTMYDDHEQVCTLRQVPVVVPSI